MGRACYQLVLGAPSSNCALYRVRTICWGLQKISKYNEGVEAANDVRVYVACFRLKDVNTDIVLSMNSPVRVNEESSSSKVVNLEKVAQFDRPEHVIALFQDIVASLQVHDYSLFIN